LHAEAWYIAAEEGPCGEEAVVERAVAGLPVAWAAAAAVRVSAGRFWWSRERFCKATLKPFI
jgi:hypothetical protein